MFTRKAKIRAVFLASGLCFLAAVLPTTAKSAALPEATTHCVPHSAEHIDGFVSDGLNLAALPDTFWRHAGLKAQAWIESRWLPWVVNTYDQNAIEGHPSVGLEQVEPITWNSTPTGKVYPFSPCAFDPVVSVAVRAELFERGWFH